MNISVLVKRTLEQGVRLFLQDGKLRFQLQKGKEFPPQLREVLNANKAEIVDYLQGLSAGGASASQTTILVQPRDGAPLPMSFAQQRLWFLDRLGGNSVQYNLPKALRLYGDFRIDWAQQALTRIVARHETLRTVFVEYNEQPCQLIQPASDFHIEQIDLRHLAPSEAEQRLAVLMAQDATTPFDLTADLMMRTSFVHMPEQQGRAVGVLMFNMHHIASDSWSLGILNREFMTQYQAVRARQADPLAPLTVQYADYSLWQRERLQGQLLAEQLDYWKKQLAGVEPIHGLALDYPRPAVKQTASDKVISRLSAADSDQLQQFANRHSVTPFMVYHAVLALVLARHSNNPDVVIGTSVANRLQRELTPMIGFFINYLTLRCQVDEQQDFMELLNQVRQVNLCAQSHQDVTFEKLVDHLKTPRTTAYTPLYQIMLVMNNADFQGFELDGISVEPIDNTVSLAKVDLELIVNRDGESTELLWLYDVALFARERIALLDSHFRQLLHALLKSPGQPLHRIDMMSDEQKARLCALAQPSEQVALYQLRVDHWFINQAEKTPEQPAIVSADGATLSYRQLQQKVERLAACLQDMEIGEGTRVGILLPRSAETLLALLAIVRVGACYVALEPSLPKDRLEFIIEDADVELVLLNTPLLDKLGNGFDVMLLDEWRDPDWLVEHSESPRLSDDSAAPMYILYTSGSSGLPKGVMVPHSAVINYLQHALCHYFGADNLDAVVSSPLCFDATLTSMLTPLCAGGCVRFVAEDSTETLELCRLLMADKPYLFKLTPAHLLALVALPQAEQGGNALHVLVIGGEALSAELCQKWRDLLPNALIINEYGPTETVVGCCIYTAKPGEAILTDPRGYVPIGTAIANTRLYVVDALGRLASDLSQGELYIAGAGVTLGYVGLEQLTAERFVSDHFAGNDGMMYKSGDRVRRLLDGNLSYLGRIDRQLKWHGYRIEPDEIELRLLSHSDVRDARVVLQHLAPGNERLVGYILSSVEQPQQTLVPTLKSLLSHVLPQYMVPAHLVCLPQWPLTANGKVDIAALPLPQGSLNANRVTPRNDCERTLQAVWGDLLGLDKNKLGMTDNFFELGGDSIISIQVVKRAREAGLYFDLQDFFAAQTIEQLAALATPIASPSVATVEFDQRFWPLPVQHQFFNNLTDWHHYNQSLLLRVAASLETSLIQQMAEHLYRCHDALRIEYRFIDDKWQGHCRDVDSPLPNGTVLSVEGISIDDRWHQWTGEQQASLDPGLGRLFKFCHIRRDDTADQLLLIIHHLAVDSVSWRILLEQLQQMFEQHRQGLLMTLTPPETQYRQWGRQLQLVAEQGRFDQQLDYWLTQQNNYDCLPSNARLQGVKLKRLQRQLSSELTEQLLSQAPAAYRTRINELLLAALLQAVRRGQNVHQLTIALEGHGRELLDPPLDLSRTLGWFTTIFPLTLAVPQRADIAELICTVKDSHRSVPDKGLGYGVLRYIVGKAELIEAREPQLLFNYLGQFDQTLDSAADFTLDDTDCGDTISHNRAASHDLNLQAFVVKGQLSLELTFDGGQFEDQSVAALLEDLVVALQDIVSHCLDNYLIRQKPVYTPADFPQAIVDMATLQLWVGEDQVADLYLASPMQQGLWFQSLLSPGSYVTQVLADFRQLDVDAFRVAWQQTTQANDILRTRFVGVEQGNTHQLVSAQAQLQWRQLDLRGSSPQSLVEYARSDRIDPFVGSSLMRFTLAQLDDDHWRLIWSHHHALLDGWSMPLIFDQVRRHYAAVRRNSTYQPAPTAQYGQYIRYLQGCNEDAAKSYWLQLLADFDGPTPLPFMSDGQRVIGSGQTRRLAFDQVQTAKLKLAAQQVRTTVNLMLQAAWALLLSRYADSRKVVFGAVNAGRPAELSGVDTMLGVFIQTLPVVADTALPGDLSTLLSQLQQQQVAVEKHGHLPLSTINKLCGHDSLFDSLLVFENYPIPLSELKDDADQLQVVQLAFDEATHYDICLKARLDEVFTIELAFADNGLSAQQLGRIVDDLQHILLAFAEQPLTDLDQVKLPSCRIPLVSHGRPRELPQELLIHRAFERKVREQGELPAIIFEEQMLSYNELNQQANRMARLLRDKGVAPDTPVGLLMHRSIEMTVAILAILKAGGAWVPFATDSPPQRLQWLLQDTQVHLLIASQDLIEQHQIPPGVVAVLPQCPQWQAQLASYDDDDLALLPQQGGNSLAYILYTSGSTGQPKGVMVEHRALYNRLDWMQSQFPLTPADRILQKTPYTFDVSIWEFLWTLGWGATMVAARPDGHRDPQYLSDCIARHRVSILHFVPSMLKAYLSLPDTHMAESVRWIFCSGEALAGAQITQLRQRAQHVELHNLYGPTEAAIDVSHFDCSRWKENQAVPIGTPIQNTFFYVLDSQLKLCPYGAVGELMIGGEGLARGYWQRAELSAEKFIDNPFGPGRLYRSGDLVRYLEDGELAYIGRSDHQLKIRGQRIEPGEIEQQLLAHEEVEAALVTSRPTSSGHLQLLAFVEPCEANKNLSESLLTSLLQQLPDYMLPDAIVMVDYWPLTANGKIDRSALLAMPVGQTDNSQPLNDPLELQLQQLWADVLNLAVDQIPRDGNFFSLGGDSILAILLVSRATNQGLALTLQQLFSYPTLAQQALLLKKSVEGQQQYGIGSLKGECPLLPIQRRFLSDETELHHFNQSMLLSLPDDFDSSSLVPIWQALVAHHDALRLVFNRRPQWHAEFADFDPDKVAAWVSVEHGVAGDQNALLQRAEQLQASLAPEHGELVRVACFPGQSGHGRLLLVIHHLVVDGVSWRILLDELDRLYRQYMAGEQLQPSSKTTDVRSWQHYLSDEQTLARHRKQLPLWQEMLAGEPLAWRKDDVDALEPWQSQSEQISLSPSHTDALLTRCCEVYHSRIVELLLAAALWGNQLHSGAERLSLVMEGHGRETLAAELDLSRTIGCFTSIYPLTLKLADNLMPSAVVNSVKQSLRVILDNGLGFDILCCFDGHSALSKADEPQLLFNYLGRFDGSDKSDAAFTIAAESSGANVSPQRRPSHPVILNGWVHQGQFHFNLTFDAKRYDAEAGRQWLNYFKRAIIKLIEGAAPAQIQWCPADFPLAHVGEQQLNDYIGQDQLVDLYPATPMQQGLLFHSQLELGSYTTQIVLQIRDFDEANFRAAWQQLITRHEIFRTAFVGLSEGRALQKVVLDAELPWRTKDLTGLSSGVFEDALTGLIEADRNEGFDVQTPPLMRITLVKMADDRCTMIWSHHHALLDGWSMPTVMNELLAIYGALRAGQVCKLTPAMPYRRYLEWLSVQPRADAEIYWRECTSHLEGTCGLPLAAECGLSPLSAAPVRQTVSLSPSHSELIARAARNTGTTVNVILQAAYALCLSQCSGERTVIFGTTSAGRPADLPGVEQAVGLFINTVPVVLSVSGDITVAQWLKELHQALVERERYGYLPLTDIAALSGRQRLFESLLVFENYPLDQSLVDKAEHSGLVVEKFATLEQTSYGLTITAKMREQLVLELQGQNQYYDEQHLAAFAEMLASLLVRLSESLGNRVDSLRHYDQQQLQQWKQMLNPARRSFANSESIASKIAVFARHNGDAVALTFAGENLSYRRLDSLAGQLAVKLRATGIVREQPVGICLPRSMEMVIAMLAVLKAGAAYVPLDPVHPAQRISHILNDANVQLVISDKKRQEAIASFEGERYWLDEQMLQWPDVDPELDVEITPEQLAYIIYTSGSTGRPKGVMVEHRHFMRLLAACQDEFALCTSDVWSNFHTFAFDFSVWEIWGALCTGARLVIVPEGTCPDTRAFYQLLSEQKVTVLSQTPGAFYPLAEVDRNTPLPLSLRLVVFGGEALKPKLLADWLNRHGDQSPLLVNMYGITETTVHVTHRVITRKDVASGQGGSPIGRALADLSLSVRDRFNSWVGPGIIGQLYISGAGVSRGYHGQRELTTERFVELEEQLPVEGLSALENRRCYATGDLVYYDFAGELMYVGRADHQVKLRGYRVETAEIEVALCRHPAVTEAVVALDHSAAQLYAWYVASDPQLQGEELRSFVSQYVPAYMLPTSLIAVTTIPLTVNGKVDVTSLLATDRRSQQFVEPQGETELALVQIWRGLLNKETIGRYDNFFELGGHSLLLTRLAAALEASFAVEMPIKILFEQPTLNSMAIYLERKLRLMNELKLAAEHQLDDDEELLI